MGSGFQVQRFKGLALATGRAGLCAGHEKAAAEGCPTFLLLSNL